MVVRPMELAKNFRYLNSPVTSRVCARRIRVATRSGGGKCRRSHYITSAETGCSALSSCPAAWQMQRSGNTSGWSSGVQPGGGEKSEWAEISNERRRSQGGWCVYTEDSSGSYNRRMAKRIEVQSKRMQRRCCCCDYERVRCGGKAALCRFDWEGNSCKMNRVACGLYGWEELAPVSLGA
jgi:hypothetical protein